MEKFNLLVAGHGFVGQAHAQALQCSETEINIYDPAKGYIRFPDKVDAAIIAVATPQAEDGSCYMDNVFEVIEKCPPSIPILIKSTISLEGWREIQSRFRNRNISFSPEYLRAAHAFKDFEKQTIIRIGGGDVLFWQTFLGKYLGITVHQEDPECLILAKYFRNSFLATKVAFFNQIYDLCREAGVDSIETCILVAEDERIGSSHSIIKRERGFGGHCFPKDTSAIVKTAELFGYDLSIIKEAIEYNDRIRK